MFMDRTQARGYSNMAVGSICGPENAQVGAPKIIRTPEAPWLSTGVSATISRTGDVATVSATAHLLVVGDTAFISGAVQPAYNGPKRVATVADANTFTYEVLGEPTTPATGTITSQKTIS